VLKGRAWGAAGSLTVASAIVKALNTIPLVGGSDRALPAGRRMVVAVCWAVRHMDADEVRVTRNGIHLKAPRRRGGDGHPQPTALEAAVNPARDSSEVTSETV
jgi:hypothetical protein